MWNSWVLLAAQALNGVGGVVVIAFGALAGAYLLGPGDSLVTLPPAGYTVGLALGALPAALLMQRIGRRPGFIAGNILGIAGAAFAALAIYEGWFAPFVVALGLVGASASFVQQYRFAAAEGAPANLRGAAISRVMIGGIVTALAGPPLMLATRDLLAPVPFAGAFLMAAGVTVIGLLVLTRLRPVPPPAQHVTDMAPRRFSEIARQPRFIVSLLCATTSFAVMTFAMTAAPLAIVGHHHSEAEAVFGIQWHIIAMFAPSFFTGRLIARFGKEAVTFVGLLLLLVSALVALAGVELLHFWAMLILLGLGWNFGFIGSTAMLTDTYRPGEKGRVEGFNDLVVFGTVAVASFLSGRILVGSGWSGINLMVLPVIGTVLLTLLLLAIQSWRQRKLS